MSMKGIFRRAEAVLAFLTILISFSLSIEAAQKADYSSFLKNKLELYSKFGERFIYNQKILSIKNISTGETRISKIITVGAFITVVVPPVGTMLNEREYLENIQTKTLPTDIFPYILISSLFFLGLILFGNYLKSYFFNLKSKVRTFLSSPSIHIRTVATTAFDVVFVAAIAAIAFLLGFANVIKLTTIFTSWLSSELTQEIYYTVLAVFVVFSGLLTYGLRLLSGKST